MAILENNNFLIETSSNGAELIKVYSKTKDIEFLWNGNKQFWSRHSPILFPIVGKLKDNETIIDNKIYKMNQHGFARDMKFTVYKKSINFIIYKLESDSFTKKLYPYDFELLVKYTLKNNTIKVDWSVFNNSDKTMYFSIGAHPAFNIPFYKNESLEDYFLSFDCKNILNSYSLEKSFISSKNTITNMKTLNLQPKLFKNDALIYDNTDKISIQSRINDISIDIIFNNFPFVGIWSPYYIDSNSIAPFLCIEPWYGIADFTNSNKLYNEKIGINSLNIGQYFEASYSIVINI